MRLTLAFYYLVKEKKNDYKKKEQNIIENKGKTKTNVLFYPMAYYAKIFQPILTYANEANRIQPRLRNGKRKKKKKKKPKN